MGICSIEASNLKFSYEKNLRVIDGLSFRMDGCCSVGIIGANGTGKSTLLKLLVGLVTNYSGSLTVAGYSVNKKNLSEIRKYIGYVFQDSDSQLFMSTVYDDVAFAPMNYGIKGQQLEICVDNALKMTHISHIRDKHTFALSGGEKKLASIATVLSMTPKIILMDEPTAALDPRNRRNIINILNSLECMKIITSHDLDMILDTCERTILINNGRIAADGKTSDILSDEHLLEENGLELPLSLCRK